MKPMLRAVFLIASSFAVAVFSTGCGGGSQKDKIWVYRYPGFYRPQTPIKRVAVHRFENRTRSRGVAARISDTISTYLTNNGTYEVYDRQRLKGKILAEQDMALTDLFDPKKAIATGKLISAQVLIYGACNRYEVTTRNETRYNNQAVMGYNAQGVYVIRGWRKVPYQWTRHDAIVECHVLVVDAVTGRQIAAVQKPTTFWASGSPPNYTAADCLRRAEQAQANMIYQALAITRQEIKLKGDVLRTATALYDNKWDWQRRIPADDKEFFVVVDLPSAADKNRFKLSIVPKGSRTVAAKKDFAWPGRSARYGLGFDAAKITAAHGLGKYTAKVYSGNEPFATYEFEIVETK